MQANYTQRAEAVAKAGYEYATGKPWDTCPEQNRDGWVQQAAFFCVQLDAAMPPVQAQGGGMPAQAHVDAVSKTRVQ